MHKRVLLRLLMILPYAFGSKLLSAISRPAFLQRLLFKPVGFAMKALKQELELLQSVSSLTHRHVVSTVVDPWRIKKLASMSEANYQKWVTIKNLPLLQAHIDNGNGVLLANTHSGMSRFLPLVLDRVGVEITTLEADPYYKKLNIQSAKGFRSIEMRSSEGFYLKALFKAKKILKKNGVLLMAPDGLQGMGDGKNYPFLNKQRPFFGAFANLAVQAGSPVIWANFHVTNDGRVEIEFELCPSLDGVSKDEMAEYMVDHYIKHVEKIWREDIATVQSKHLRYYLSLETLSEARS